MIAVKLGDLVEFATLLADELPCTFRVLEVNGDRCFIEAQVGMVIRPTQVVATADLVSVVD